LYINNDSRLLTTSTVSVFGASTGSQVYGSINTELKKLYDNVDEITATAAFGKYCIMLVGNNAGVMTG
jgi:hypothetical protein